MGDWFTVANVSEVESPSLLIYPDRIRENIRRMVAIAGSADRLCPHVKTHKLAEVIRLQMDQGIQRFKCATLAEAEMVAGCGAKSVLLSYQPVGPNVARLIRLVRAFPEVAWSVIADDEVVIRSLSAACAEARCVIDVLLDLDVGMHRTGVADPQKAFHLAGTIRSLAGLRFGGLHAYDGHLHEGNAESRAGACAEAYAPVAALRERFTQNGIPVPRVVAGGTPTFAMHARRGDVECSPGTCALWDAGYATILPDLDFLPAALVLTRVVSRPAPTRLCLDLGHKAIASEMPPPRVQFLNLPNAKPVMHNEEHLVVETPNAAEFPVGACIYGIPWHICPTVALHAEAVVIENGLATQHWETRARDRRIDVACRFRPRDDLGDPKPPPAEPKA